MGKKRVFSKQQIKTLNCFILNDKPMSAYDVAKDKKFGFDNRTRSGEVKKYCEWLFECGLLIYSKEDNKYKTDWKNPVLLEIKKLGQVATRRTKKWTALFLEKNMARMKLVNNEPIMDMSMEEFRDYYKEFRKIEKRDEIDPKKAISLMNHTRKLIDDSFK